MRGKKTTESTATGWWNEPKKREVAFNAGAHGGSAEKRDQKTIVGKKALNTSGQAEPLKKAIKKRKKKVMKHPKRVDRWGWSHPAQRHRQKIKPQKVGGPYILHPGKNGSFTT